ncbi:hypothetical protein K461DRAFT_116058 [Myriangium duriaei CBS 260.36]|uniref:Uncharacterized protein n=1 Tax=Myriangium duriaei CBS 260.36 TaxID=1168546 RepID=A0A9P4J3E7_9PEZI|nr:hypothetical protein K461DRAFT_116058 [Myriangium duriaei CBS 260.36]
MDAVLSIAGIRLSAQHTVILAICSSWLLLHRILSIKGFTFHRSAASTDIQASVFIVTSTMLWAYFTHVTASTTLGLISFTSDSNEEAREKMIIPDSLITYLAGWSNGPIIAQSVSILWVVASIDSTLAARSSKVPLLWSLRNISSPFDWQHAFSSRLIWALRILVSVQILASSTASFVALKPIQAISDLLALAIFLFNGIACNSYVKAPHEFGDDCLRIALGTSHHEGTVYLLPSSTRRFDAVWSPKVDDENVATDEQVMTLFSKMRSRQWGLHEPLERLRSTLARYQQRVVISTAQLEYLAAWLYVGETARPGLPQVLDRRIDCNRMPGTHLLGRDLIYALCHAEYLVFMGQGRLHPTTRSRLGSLRFMERSGAADVNPTRPHAIGFAPGMQGFLEAARHIHLIFGEDLDGQPLSFEGLSPPKTSSAISGRYIDIDSYVAELWNTSCSYSESTFTAMYWFSLVWSMEMGNVAGFHLFPLQCRDRNGDFVSEQIVFRQLWKLALISQMIAASYPLFILYVAGIMV